MNQDITAEDAQFLAEVAAESIGWLPFGGNARIQRTPTLVNITPIVLNTSRRASLI